MKPAVYFILALTMCISIITKGQTVSNTGASQSANLALQNGIDISYINTGNTSGNEAIMEFLTVNDFNNGVPSIDQELRVRSNQAFSVRVRCEESSFSYSGNSNITMQDLPPHALQLMVIDNKTGGTIKAPYSNTNYAAIRPTDEDLFINGKQGGNRTFNVRYRYKPGYVLPAGVYKVDVIYTATQQ